MTRLEEVRKLRGGGRRKKTYEEIGQELGITRQRVWAIATGYEKRYRHTSNYLMYKRHAKHDNPRKPCNRCAQDKANLSMLFTNPDY